MPLNPFKRSHRDAAERKQSGVSPLPNNTADFVEYACMSHSHVDVPHYYKRRRGNGSTCDCGRSN